MNWFEIDHHMNVFRLKVQNFSSSLRNLSSNKSNSRKKMVYTVVGCALLTFSVCLLTNAVPLNKESNRLPDRDCADSKLNK